MFFLKPLEGLAKKQRATTPTRSTTFTTDSHFPVAPQPPMLDNGQGPKSGKVVGNGPRMVARGCQRSPEVPVDLKRGLQTVPRPGGAARGQIRRNRGSPPAHQ